ncbi:MAG: histidine kinase, partial [Deltaproteobacteria bacterium]|nr:histidine kinase [Deltaproteobacteria bacterium]
SDASLGLPVKWSQIAGARVIVETSFGDRVVEPSQGTHFFHNLLALHIGYLTLANDEGGPGSDRQSLDRAWLASQPVCHEAQYVRHVRLEAPLKIYLDGRTGSASILKPVPVVS